MLFSASVTIQQAPAISILSMRPVPTLVGTPSNRSSFGVTNVHFYEEDLTPTPNTNPPVDPAITEDDEDVILIDDYYSLGF